MSWHTNNPDCSVTVVNLAGCNGDDHFLLLVLKGAGGLVDSLPHQFHQDRIMSVYQVLEIGSLEIGSIECCCCVGGRISGWIIPAAAFHMLYLMVEQKN